MQEYRKLQVEESHIVYYFRQNCDAVITPECLRADNHIQISALECCGPLARQEGHRHKGLANALLRCLKIPHWPMLAFRCKASL